MLRAARGVGQHGLVEALLENRSPEEIASYFAAEGLVLYVHANAPIASSRSEIRHAVSDSPGVLTTKQRATHWADLTKANGEVVARWYGSGFAHDDALRSAAQRWRVEQVGTDNQRHPGQGLP